MPETTVDDLIYNPAIRGLTVNNVTKLSNIRRMHVDDKLKLSITQKQHRVGMKLYSCILMREIFTKKQMLNSTVHLYDDYYQQVTNFNLITNYFYDIYEWNAIHFEDITNTFYELQSVAIEYYDRSTRYRSIPICKSDIDQFNHYIDNVLHFLNKMLQFSADLRLNELDLQLILMQIEGDEDEEDEEVEIERVKPELCTDICDDNDETSSDCPICLDEKVCITDMGILQCEHMFCLKCLDLCFEKENSNYRCSLCRANVTHVTITCSKQDILVDLAKYNLMMKYCK